MLGDAGLDWDRLQRDMGDPEIMGRINANLALGRRLDVQGTPAYVIGDRPWLATDPILDPWTETPDLDVVQTGAWILPDVRPLPYDLEAFLHAGTPPVYVGFGSMPLLGANDIGRITAVIDALQAAR